MSLTAVFVHRPPLVFVLLALMGLAGTLAYRTLVQQLFPNVSVPTVSISVTYNGASPTIMRDTVVAPVENALAGTQDLQTISSNIQAGRATISAAFLITSDVNTDLVNTLSALQIAQHQLPLAIQPPTVSVRDPSEATVVTLSMTSSKLTEGQLALVANNEVAPAITQIADISFVTVGGVANPAYEVVVDPQKLAAANLTLNDVVTTVATSNTLAPGGIAYGRNRQTQIVVRGDIYQPSSIAFLPIAPPATGGTAATTTMTPGSTTTSVTSGALSAGTGTVNPWTAGNSVLRISDIATVVNGYEPRTMSATVNGINGVFLSVQKTSTSSEVTASNNVVAALPRLRAQFPDVNFGIVNVQSKFTEQQIQGTINTLIEGIALTGIVMLFFLGSWRNAIVVLIAIPASLCVALFVMKMMGLTLDTISLLGMTLVIGILVDDSTVVLENIERHRELGEPPDQAAIKGRNEIGTAAIVITMVDVVVFLPIAFLQSQVGRNLVEFAIVIVISTLTSLFVSFTITPSLAANWALRGHWKPFWIIRAFETQFNRARSLYVHRILPWGLRHRVPFVAFCFASLVFAVALVPLGVVGETFIPPIFNGQVFVQVSYPVGTELTTTNSAVIKLEHELRKLPEIASDTALAGGYSSPYGGLLVESNVGQIQIFLTAKGTAQTAYWVNQYRQIAAKTLPNTQVLVIPSTGQTGGNAQPLDELVSDTTGGDPTPYAQKVYATLLHTPGATNVNSSVSGLSPQVELLFQRAKMRSLNVSLGTATTAAAAAFGGAIATQFESPLGLIQVQVIYPRDQRNDLSTIAAIPVRSASGQIVHLGDFSTFKWTPTPPLITRVNRQTVIDVSANFAANTSLSNVQNAFMQRVAAMHLPKNIVVRPRPLGQQDLLNQTLIGLGTSLILSVVLVFLLMVALYNSYLSPLIIMFSVPVAAVGALGALALTHQTLNLFSLIGTIMLVGIVTKNGVLLVDYANTLRRRGEEKLAAIQESAFTRFRPIMMTSISVVAGNVPLALALEPGSGVRSALGVVVIGGILSSLFLTLILVPIMYVWLAPKHFPVTEPAPSPGRNGTSGSDAPLPAHA
jgi:hydrophobic/amphiphilic exporter-1 (mainly G- bacteria), HAE1 family